MQPVEAEAEAENVEAVAEFEAGAEAEPVADEQPTEAVAHPEDNPFDSWAQQSAELPYLNGQSHEDHPVADVNEQPTNSWAMPEAHASADVWTELGADASAEPFAEFAEPPAGDALAQPAGNVWGEPMADLHADGRDGDLDADVNGNGNGHAWQDTSAEEDAKVLPVEAEIEPVTEPARSWSPEHASWETDFADALAELDAKPRPVEAWSTTSSSEDASHWGGAEAQSWDEAARVD
jgi:hypothetical protein